MLSPLSHCAVGFAGFFSFSFLLELVRLERRIDLDLMDLDLVITPPVDWVRWLRG
jgi:hypothetical protein